MKQKSPCVPFFAPFFALSFCCLTSTEVRRPIFCFDYDGVFIYPLITARVLALFYSYDCLHNCHISISVSECHEIINKYQALLWLFFTLQHLGALLWRKTTTRSLLRVTCYIWFEIQQLNFFNFFLESCTVSWRKGLSRYILVNIACSQKGIFIFVLYICFFIAGMFSS